MSAIATPGAARLPASRRRSEGAIVRLGQAGQGRILNGDRKLSMGIVLSTDWSSLLRSDQSTDYHARRKYRSLIRTQVNECAV